MNDPVLVHAGAVAHGQALAHAAAELVRYGREGSSLPRFPFGIEDISAILAEALDFTLGTELAVLEAADDPCAAEEISSTGQMRAALGKWFSDNGFVDSQDFLA